MATAGNSSSNPSAPVPLDYAPASGRRKKWLKRTVLIIASALIIVSAWHWGSDGWSWIQIQYWQWQVLHYSPPRDQIVFDEIADERLSLLNQRGYFTSFHHQRSDATAFMPAALNEYLKISGYSLVSSAQGKSAVCFLGALKTPSGQSHLVIVQWTGMAWYPSPLGGRFRDDVAGWAQVIVPQSLFGSGAMTPGGDRGFCGSWAAISATAFNSAHERVWAGQVDPADSSHFTIRYEIWGQQDILDGRIDNYDQVTLIPRHQPTTGPSNGAAN